jgi:hypothetical protein
MSLLFLYLVNEVDKGGLLMVFLKWMTQLWVEYSGVGGEIGPNHKPPLYSSHGKWPASKSLAWLLIQNQPRGHTNQQPYPTLSKLTCTSILQDTAKLVAHSFIKCSCLQKFFYFARVCLTRIKGSCLVI